MRQSVILSALGVVLLATGGVQLAAQQPALPVQVLKVSSGPSGSEVNGNFVLTSERSVFNRNDDREVIVLFQWDAVPGPHRLVAQWRSPDSATTSSSTVNYIAKEQRFGAYWSLPLSASMTLGTWSIEATVDGVPAGRLTFEVTDNRVSSPPGKSMLTQASLYERLNRAFVVLQRTSKVGRELSPTAGFSPAPGLIYTAMSTLDGADEILMVSRDGATTPATTAVAWNRRQHWAVLSGVVDVDVLPIAPADATKVGTRCVSMEGAAATGRVLSECSITGHDAQGALIAMFSVGNAVAGAPVLNEFGELIGLVGARGEPGERATAYRLRDSIAGTPIVPIGLVKFDAAAPRQTLLDLRSRGVTVPRVIGGEHVMTGGFGPVDAKGKLVSTEHRDELSMRDKAFGVFVMWSPKERLRGLMTVRLFDEDNLVVLESKPAKVDLRKDQTPTSSWSLPILKKTGVYRADVLLNSIPIWRGFLRITP